MDTIFKYISTEDLLIFGILYLIPILVMTVGLSALNSKAATIVQHLEDIFFEVQDQGKKESEDKLSES